MERLPGFRDFYPEPLPHPDVWSADARQHIFDQWRATARRYGFREYDGPPLEPLELFTTKSGEEIVGQLYNFTDKGNREVALRPEMTPTLARMVAAHERNYKKPVKWFAIPQLFRYERQQKGRLREHFQFNADLIGEADLAADAELIALLIDTLRSFGLTESDFVIRLSSRNAWHEFYKSGAPASGPARHDSQRAGSEIGAPGDAAREYDFFQTIDKLERTAPDESGKKLSALGFSLAAVNRFIESGKPTAAVQLIEALAKTGLKVGSLKHTDHEYETDVEGKDSQRHKAAGANPAVLVAGRRSAVHRRWDSLASDPLTGAAEASVRPALSVFLEGEYGLRECDVVIVEGYRSETYPKIEVCRGATGRAPLCEADPNVLAVVTDHPTRHASSIPRFSFSEIPGLLLFLKKSPVFASLFSGGAS